LTPEGAGQRLARSAVFNKIEQCRRVAMGEGELNADYLAFIELASTCLWLAHQ
jgi:hypothetical protein